MDLFEAHRQDQLQATAPLALRLRPQTLDQVVGQEQIIGPGKLLRRAIETDQLSSVILHGPPGTGKTTLARVIAQNTKAHFQQVNAVTAGVAELKQAIADARKRRAYHGQRTILFIDEIHRFNKAQQDALLPAVEEGLVILVGATTENPYFEINSALLSRSRIFRLEPLSREAISCLIQRSLSDADTGLGHYQAELEPAALEHLIAMADGDARVALNALEMAVTSTPPAADGSRLISLSVAEDSIQRRAVRYDRTGDQHYDIISAYIKSMRGSDPDAALHWLARMLDAGEDPRFIARRMVILAAEDIGLADPQALVIANSAAQALELVGMPEARLPLAQATIYLACAPKSNSVICAIDAALADVKSKGTGQVPPHLRNTHYRGAQQLGHGQGYKYPHDYEGNYIAQQYLPDDLLGTRYYTASDNGEELQLKSRRKQLGAQPDTPKK